MHWWFVSLHTEKTPPYFYLVPERFDEIKPWCQAMSFHNYIFFHETEGSVNNQALKLLWYQFGKLPCVLLATLFVFKARKKQASLLGGRFLVFFIVFYIAAAASSTIQLQGLWTSDPTLHTIAQMYKIFTR